MGEDGRVVLHIIGKILLLGGMSACGLFYALRLQKRVSCLREILLAVERLERELFFALLPVEELLRKMGESAHGMARRFFGGCEQRFHKRGEERLEDIWVSEMKAGYLPLEEEDLNILQEVGAVLGKYDGDSQKLALERIYGRLEEVLSKAKERSARQSKVYGILGVAAGVFCVIML